MDKKKVILFGDSLLANFYDTNAQEVEQGAGMEVYNCATSGWSTEDGVKKSEYIARLKPDFVVFSFGTNDSGARKHVELNNFVSNLQKISETFSCSKKIYFIAPPVDEKSTDHFTNETIKKYAETTKEFAKKEGSQVIDSWKVFPAMLESGVDYHEEDGVHFSDEGLEKLAEEIISAIK